MDVVAKIVKGLVVGAYVGSALLNVLSQMSEMKRAGCPMPSDLNEAIRPRFSESSKFD